MEILKSLFNPLTRLTGRTLTMVIIAEVALALGLWQIFGGGGLIPTPFQIVRAVVSIVTLPSFADNLFSSLGLTLSGMGISIILALLISYLSLLPAFAPLARFIVKCRYLTLTGLIFLFTLLTQDGHQLKLSLLVFGIVPFFVTSLLSIIESINSQEYDLCRTLRMNNWQTLFEVVIIGRMDQVFEVMRQNFAIAWMMITMVEGLSMSEGGLGTMLIKSNKYIDLSTVFGILVIIFVMGILFDYLLKNMRYWLFPYAKLQIRK
ncbi:ABC transporter permease subunit [Chryseolinea sp. T2]|uniref:ABC transporter permease n=1 Tax=Chryseolinea sp. T2 TaxID=3129255 RepID=UPI0030789EBA